MFTEGQGYYLLGNAVIGVAAVFYPPLSAALIFGMMLVTAGGMWIYNCAEESDRRQNEINRTHRL